jgi:polyisoprenoid-binding protein YceI
VIIYHRVKIGRKPEGNFDKNYNMATTTWQIDAGHSQIGFKVKHLGIANVNGVFRGFNGEMVSNGDVFDQAEVRFSIDVKTIDTSNAQRDEHLRSDLFFDAERFPGIMFSGKLVQGGSTYQLVGDMTILGTTIPVMLEVQFTGTGTGRFGERRAGFEVSGKIRRKDFGLNFHLLNDAGDLVVGEEVKLAGDIEMCRQ